MTQKVVSVARTIAARVEERLVLCVRDRIAVDVESSNPHASAMRAPRTALPRILHVQAVGGLAFDLDAVHREIELGRGNRDHAGRRFGCDARVLDLDDLLRQCSPFG